MVQVRVDEVRGLEVALQDSLFLGFLWKEVVSIRGAIASANREDTHCGVEIIVGYFVLISFEGGLLCVED
jgi:hypothetical protein